MIYAPNATTIPATPKNAYHSNLPSKQTKNDETFLAAAIGSIKTLKSISPQRVQARTVLWYLVFCGFAINYMIRLTVNIAIIEMIAKNPLANQTIHVSECLTSSTLLPINHSFPNNFSHAEIINTSRINVLPRYSIERTVLDFLRVKICNLYCKHLCLFS